MWQSLAKEGKTDAELSIVLGVWRTIFHRYRGRVESAQQLRGGWTRGGFPWKLLSHTFHRADQWPRWVLGVRRCEEGGHVDLEFNPKGFRCIVGTYLLCLTSADATQQTAVSLSLSSHSMSADKLAYTN